MADKPAFDPEAFLRQGERPAFDPEVFLKQETRAQDAPLPPSDPVQDMFVPAEAQRAAATPFPERAAASTQFYGPMAPMAADTFTFGLGNRGVAYGRSLIGRALGEETDYAQKVAEQNEYLKRIREEQPERAIAADLTGGMLGGAGMARAGITLARPGVGWISRAVRGGTEGALQGAAQGAGQNYGDWGDKAAAAAPGAIFGGVVGTSLPLAVSGSAGIRDLANVMRGRTAAYPPSLLRAVEADRAGLEALPQMGPEGMVPDAGPSLRVLAQGAVTQPGTGRTALIGNLTRREEATIPRMTAERERIFGGPALTPTEVRNEVNAARQAMDPEWRAAFQGAHAVDTTPIANRLDADIIDMRGDAQAALQRVRASLNVHGTNQLDPHPRTLHATRMAIDDMLFPINGTPPPPGVQRVLGDVRNRITQELHDNVPDMANLDARYAEIMSRRGAFERGQEIFDVGREQVVRPREWQQEFAEMATPRGGPRSTVQGPSLAPLYARHGVASELDRLTGTGVDDLRVLERKFGPGNYATQNLATTTGQQSADDVRRMIRTNRTFRESYQKIAQGSKTADTLGAAEDAGGFALPRLSVPGVVDLLNTGLSRAQAGAGAATRNRIAEVMALQGPARDVARRELLDAAGEQARRDITRMMIENAIRRSTIGATGPRSERRR